jgi:hypothetical protein
MDDSLLLFETMGIFPSIPPPFLYHYTSMEALLSIVSSGQIRASHARYLNDISETEWMWRSIIALLEQKKHSTESKNAALASSILDKLEDRRRLNEFVASFSENGDDLTQWRAYCSSGAGVSIGFDSACLQTGWVADPAGKEPSFVGGTLKKVRYLGPDEEAKLSSELDVLMNLSPSIDKGFDGQPITREQFLIAWLSVISPTFKHPAFSAENEWRLVLTKPHKNMPFQRFRPGRSSIIPYVEAILNRGPNSNCPADYMIKKVIIGPTPSPELSKAALESLFGSAGHPEVQIEVSNIPFRHW